MSFATKNEAHLTGRREKKAGLKMATILANRVVSAKDETLSLFRFSFNFLRNFSTSSANAAAAQNPNASSPSKKRRRKKKNLFEVAQFLPNWGIGYHIAKSHWTNVSYEITKINLYKVSLSLSFSPPFCCCL